MKKNLAKLTIITPSLNGAKYLEQTIKSVLDQNYPNLEYIIVDQGSTDKTPEILKRYRAKIKVIHQKRKGISLALNAGLRKASGDIIGWINSDDYYLNKSFFSVTHFFKSHPLARWVSGDYLIVNEDNIPIRKYIVEWKKFLRKFPYKYTLLLGNYISQPSTFWRRKIIKEVGLMDKELKFNMDLDYYLRIFKIYPLYTLRKSLSAFRVSDSSLLYRYHRKSFKEQIKVLRKYFKESSLINFTKFMNFIYGSIYSILKKTKHFVVPERIDPLNSRINSVQKNLHINRYRYIAEFAKNLSKPKQVILDAGCGLGYGSKILKRAVKNVRVIGVDVDRVAINYANLKYKEKNIRFMVGDLRKLKFPSNYFDCIVCFETIEHLNYGEAKKCLKELFRVLKPGGILAVSSPNRLFTKLIKLIFKFNNPYHKHDFSPGELLLLLKALRFKILRVLSQFQFLSYPTRFIPPIVSTYFIVLAKKIK